MIPNVTQTGGFLIIILFLIVRATKSTRFTGFVFIGNETVELGTTKGKSQKPFAKSTPV